MKWTCAFLVALLLRIAAAVDSVPNPFIGEVSGVTLNKPFTVNWTPTTVGTVTLTIIEMDDNDGPTNNLVILGCTLLIPHVSHLTASIATKANSRRSIANVPNTGSFTSTLDKKVPSAKVAVRLITDSEPYLVSYSTTFEIADDPNAPVSSTYGYPVYTDLPPTDDPTPSTVPSTSTPPPSQSSISSISSSSSRSSRSSSTAASAPSADTTTAKTASPLPSETSTPSSKGLSPGAAAGIGVGATLGVLILATIAAFFWWRSRKRPSAPEAASKSASAVAFIEYDSKKRAVVLLLLLMLTLLEPSGYAILL